MKPENRGQGSGISDELLGKTWTELRWLWEAERQARQAADARVAELEDACEAHIKARDELADGLIFEKAAREQAEAKLAEAMNHLVKYSDHLDSCGIWKQGGDCNCGINDLFREAGE